MPLTWPPRTDEVAPYARLAPAYDHLMRHVNYARWATYLVGLFGLASGAVRSVLDVSCGTGSLLIELANAGYDVLGFDRSWGMVAQARRKLAARRLGGQTPATPLDRLSSARLWCGDMHAFALRHPVDATLCIYDSMNYCDDLGGVARVVSQAADAVRPGGLFVFDVCTEHNCRVHFADYYEQDAVAEFSYRRRAYYDPRQRLQINEIDIVDERQPAVFREVHRQRIFAIADLQRLCDGPPWELLGCFAGFTRRPGDEQSDRVHFALRRR